METYEIDAYGGDVDVGIVAVGETNEKGRFATSAVAHDDDLEEVVAAELKKRRLGHARAQGASTQMEAKWIKMELREDFMICFHI